MSKASGKAVSALREMVRCTHSHKVFFYVMIGTCPKCSTVEIVGALVLPTSLPVEALGALRRRLRGASQQSKTQKKNEYCVWQSHG